MRKSIDDAVDNHPPDDDERPPVSWAVAVSDDCDACGAGELRVVLTVEEAGRAGYGLVAHLAPAKARPRPTARPTRPPAAPPPSPPPSASSARTRAPSSAKSRGARSYSSSGALARAA